MIVSKEQAKEMWCPFARYQGNNRAIDPDLCNCLTDQCMAWRPMGKDRGECSLAFPIDPRL